MREYFRPYNKVIDIADVNQHNVILTDTSGGFLDCNFVSVTVISGTTAHMFQVIPSGINTMFGPAGSGGGAPGDCSGRNWGPSAYNNANSRISNSASGSLGLVANGEAGTVILSLAPYDVTNAIIITQSPASASARYAITYGHVSLANQRADNTWSMGEQTYSDA